MKHTKKICSIDENTLTFSFCVWRPRHHTVLRSEKLYASMLAVLAEALFAAHQNPFVFLLRVAAGLFTSNTANLANATY